MAWIAGIAGFVAGGALVWFFKEKIQSLVIDANTLAAKLRAKADAIANAAKK
jgi:hypothetical protein